MMRFIILFFILSTNIYAKIGSPVAFYRDASIIPIPTSFNNPNAALFTGAEGKTHLAITNNSVIEPIALCVNSASQSLCTDQIPVGASITMALDDIGMSNEIYIRTLADEAVTTGKIYFSIW